MNTFNIDRTWPVSLYMGNTARKYRFGYNFFHKLRINLNNSTANTYILCVVRYQIQNLLYLKNASDVCHLPSYLAYTLIAQLTLTYCV